MQGGSCGRGDGGPPHPPELHLPVSNTFLLIKQSYAFGLFSAHLGAFDEEVLEMINIGDKHSPLVCLHT